MAIEKRRRNTGAHGGIARAGRRLRLERLETRSVLSAAVFSPAPSAAAVVHATAPAWQANEVGPFSAAAQSAEFARTSPGFGRNAGAFDFASRPGFATHMGVNPGGPDLVAAPGALAEAASQTAAAAAVATPPGQGPVSLDGVQSSRYETIVVTVVWQAAPSDVPSFVALPANEAINSVVLPSPKLEANLGIAVPATASAPLPANSSNGSGIANSTTSALAPFQVAIAPPYAAPIAAAAGSAPAAELSGATDPLGGATSPTSTSASDSTEGGLLALDDMPAAAMQLDRQPGTAIGANFASNLQCARSGRPGAGGLARIPRTLGRNQPDGARQGLCGMAVPRGRRLRVRGGEFAVGRGDRRRRGHRTGRGLLRGDWRQQFLCDAGGCRGDASAA